MTTIDLILARRAEAWAALDLGEQRRIVQTRAYHFAVYAQAIGFRIAHPPKTPPAGRVNWGSLDNMPLAEWVGET